MRVRGRMRGGGGAAKGFAVFPLAGRCRLVLPDGGRFKFPRSMSLAVVIPSYNHAHYIGLALESVLRQTRRPDRIVVIDDGSKDHSLEVLEPFKARGVEVLARENRGAHFTINQAVELAALDCEFISILNSDDHYHPERFARLLPLLEQDPGKSVVCSGIRVIDGQDADISADEPRAKWFRAIWSWKDKENPDLCEWLGMANFPATTSNVIARREFLLRFPFRPYRFNHDYYFLAQAVLRDQMAVLPEPLVNYRVHLTNTINTAPAPLMREMLRMHLDLLHDLAPELVEDGSLRERLGRYLRSSWNNVSALHAGLLQVLLAGAAARLTEGEIERMVAAITLETWPEVAEFPNKALVNAHGGTTPLGVESGLAEKFAAQRRELMERRAGEKAWKELARMEQTVADSRWLALGRLLGVKFSAAGPTGEARVAALRKGLEASRWVRLGGRLGSASVKNLQQRKAGRSG